MAISVGVFSSLYVGDTASLVKFSPATVRLVPSNLRTVRTVTLAAASKPATETKKREPRGITKPRRVSPEMQAFLGGVTEIPRTQALKEIWAYIKKHNLQMCVTSVACEWNRVFYDPFVLGLTLVSERSNA
ncbi:uncharacterized protein LOC111410154 isoform X2 [Olea europaea var. sylvestris]|uniref:uncharacterized protein LOC111410154 isoform X2 n=1 Tax=Olea europaea var. sylvestris TaxID=158386 RepID=UPI000C1D2E65|nr:uncharacterized protein LOC111410154 isoform X2 [Olea europaea var. sylvestris]